MSSRKATIDVHHHVPPGYMLSSSSQSNAWSIASDMEAMDRIGIDGALLSVPVSGSAVQVRRMNCFLAELASFNIKRYGFLAAVPFEDPDKSLVEVDFAKTKLEADGFILPTNYKGIYLGSDLLVPVFEELNRIKATVLIHPTAPAGDNFPSFDRDLSVYEYPLETTRAVMDMIYKDRLKQFPEIKWIISHAGGTIPFLAYRLSIAREWEAITQSREEITAALKSLYYDIALSTSPPVFAAMRELVPSSHLLFGTDYPLRFENGVNNSIKELDIYSGYTAEDKENIMGITAQKIFPRFV